MDGTAAPSEIKVLFRKLRRDIAPQIFIGNKIDILFGSEGAGFPNFVYEKYKDRLYRIPMKTGFRSLNLSSSAAIVSYHLLHKLNFPDLF